MLFRCLSRLKHRPLSPPNKRLCSKVPSLPAITLRKENFVKVNLDSKIISLLERLSLVKCDTTEGAKILEDSIQFADKILNINTDSVEPLYSVLENE